MRKLSRNKRGQFVKPSTARVIAMRLSEYDVAGMLTLLGLLACQGAAVYSVARIAYP